MVTLKPLDVPVQEPSWLMLLDLFYDGDNTGQTSFNLHGYTLEEAQDVARNIADNPYMMKEIDEFLWGESD